VGPCAPIGRIGRLRGRRGRHGKRSAEALAVVPRALIEPRFSGPCPRRLRPQRVGAWREVRAAGSGRCQEFCVLRSVKNLS
jgi:hypothetical protein